MGNKISPYARMVKLAVLACHIKPERIPDDGLLKEMPHNCNANSKKLKR